MQTCKIHKLVLMLFEGARLSLSAALAHMKGGRFAAKGESISRAIAIINSGLQASLDIKAGGELAEQLNALYEYMGRRLLEANLHDKPEYIEEVASLLNTLSEAWEAIGASPQPAGANLAPGFPDSPISDSTGKA